MKVAIFWSLIAVWVLPFIGAAIYVNRERLLSIFGPVFHAFACLYDERARANWRLTIANNGRIGVAQLALIASQKALCRSLKIEQSLLEKVQVALNQLGELEDSSEKSNDPGFEEQVIAKRRKATVITKKMYRRISRTSELLVATEVRQTQLESIYRQICLETARTNCERVLSSIDLESARQKLQSAEAQVLEIEKRADHRQYQPADTVYDEELKELTRRADGAIDGLLGKLEAPRKKFRQIARALDDRLVSLDPSLGRAFRRLQKGRDVIHFLVGELAAQEDTLSNEMDGVQASAREFRKNAEIARAHGDEIAEGLAKQLEHKCLERIAILTDQQRKFRRRNAVIEDAVLHFEIVVRRLFVLKLLLETFPVSLGEKCAEYKLIATKLSEVLADFVRHPSEEDKSLINEHRIAALEKSALMEFLKVAKTSTKESSKLERRILLVEQQLQVELMEQQSQLDKWKNFRRLVVSDLSLLVVSRKIEVIEKFVEHLQECHEVLSVTYAFIKFKSSKSPE